MRLTPKAGVRRICKLILVQELCTWNCSCWERSRGAFNLSSPFANEQGVWTWHTQRKNCYSGLSLEFYSSFHLTRIFFISASVFLSQEPSETTGMPSPRFFTTPSPNVIICITVHLCSKYFSFKRNLRLSHGHKECVYLVYSLNTDYTFKASAGYHSIHYDLKFFSGVKWKNRGSWKFLMLKNETGKKKIRMKLSTEIKLNISSQ